HVFAGNPSRGSRRRRLAPTEAGEHRRDVLAPEGLPACPRPGDELALDGIEITHRGGKRRPGDPLEHGPPDRAEGRELGDSRGGVGDRLDGTVTPRLPGGTGPAFRALRPGPLRWRSGAAGLALS